MKQRLSVSIVIPVYNEGDCLLACLRAIENLAYLPQEVIVVDNNSTDHSREIAASFSFVKVISEAKQGVVHARSRGFDEARGDIIARIDADTILYDNWIERVCDHFADDPKLAAVSGPPDYYDFKLNRTANRIDRAVRKFLANRMPKHLFLYGSNMALRNSAWRSVRHELCNESGIHEDLDLGIHLQLEGFKISYDSQLVAGVSMRRISSGFMSFVRYSLISPRSYSVHNLAYNQYLYPVVFLCWLLYVPTHLIFLGYDQTSDTFSWHNFLVNRRLSVRIDPTTNVA